MQRKTATIRCEHQSAIIRVRVSPEDIIAIQCGLIQIKLSPAQAARVQRHCRCLRDRMYHDRQDNQDRAFITVDPSQLDLGGELIKTWRIG